LLRGRDHLSAIEIVPSLCAENDRRLVARMSGWPIQAMDATATGTVSMNPCLLHHLPGCYFGIASAGTRAPGTMVEV
jgi:hypothetical protein